MAQKVSHSFSLSAKNSAKFRLTVAEPISIRNFLHSSVFLTPLKVQKRESSVKKKGDLKGMELTKTKTIASNAQIRRLQQKNGDYKEGVNSICGTESLLE